MLGDHGRSGDEVTRGAVTGRRKHRGESRGGLGHALSALLERLAAPLAAP